MLSQSIPATRLHHSDPATDRIVQDMYDKLGQAQLAISKLQNPPAPAVAASTQPIGEGGTIFVVPSFTTTGVTQYVSPSYFTTIAGTEASAQLPVPAAGKFSNLQVVLAAAAGAGGAVIVALRVNKISTLLTVVIPASGAAGVYVSTGGAPISVANAALWDVQVVNNSGGAVTIGAIVLQFN